MKPKLSANADILRERFFGMKNLRDFAELLEVPHHLIRFQLYENEKSYTRIIRKKRRGGERIISSPCVGLKILQKKFCEILKVTTKNRNCSHAFNPGKSIKTNAKVHLGKKWILNFDIEEFFPSINFGRVYGLFSKPPFNFNKKVAAAIAKLVCYNNSLPQGAPTSPFISNLICSRLDRTFIGLCRHHKLTYSRYCDDITLSSWNAECPELMELNKQDGNKLNPEIERVLSTNGFRLNNQKTRLVDKSKRQEVTGVIINKKLNVSRHDIKMVRAALHNWKVNGFEATNNLFLKKYSNKLIRGSKPSKNLAHALKGKLEYFTNIRGEKDQLVAKLRLKLFELDNTLFSENERKRKIYPFKTTNERISDSVLVIEDETALIQGTVFYLEKIGFITCAHCLGPDSVAFHSDAPNKKYSIKILHQQQDLDFAIIQIVGFPNPNLPLQQGKSEHRKGEEVLVVGYPNYNTGESWNSRQSRIASKKNLLGKKFPILDGGIIAGMSGGPILNLKGEVIGIANRGAPSQSEQGKTELHLYLPIEECLSKAS